MGKTGKTMIKIVLRPFIFIIKSINYITVHLVKFTNLLASLIFIFIMLFLGLLYYIDKVFTGGYYASYFVQFIFTGDIDWFFRFSNMTEKNTKLSLGIFIASLLILFLLKLKFRKKLTMDKRRLNSFTNIIYLITNIFINLVALSIVSVFVLNLIVTRYVNTATGRESDIISIGFLDKIDYLREQIESDRQISSIALNKIIFDINNDYEYIADLTMDEHLKLCREVNLLIDLQNGPLAADEHYLRNKLNYAPKNLDFMLSEIANGNTLGWDIMPPDESALHMYGPDGEYNIKFVSKEGFFEAVYNKNGELLSEDNDPANMGTYNYANPLTESKKHSTYDVAPYYIWGNTPTSKPLINTHAIKNLEKFYENKDAMNRYEEIKRIVKQGSINFILAFLIPY